MISSARFIDVIHKAWTLLCGRHVSSCRPFLGSLAKTLGRLSQPFWFRDPHCLLCLQGIESFSVSCWTVLRASQNQLPDPPSEFSKSRQGPTICFFGFSRPSSTAWLESHTGGMTGRQGQAVGLKLWPKSQSFPDELLWTSENSAPQFSYPSNGDSINIYCPQGNKGPGNCSTFQWSAHQQVLLLLTALPPSVRI